MSILNKSFRSRFFIIRLSSRAFVVKKIQMFKIQNKSPNLFAAALSVFFHFSLYFISAFL
jgi:hypothetical protein